MKIGDLAARSGVSARSLRYYEAQGLLRPSRDGSGHRRFDIADVDTVLVIQELYSAGFCSTVIREVLPSLVHVGERDLSALSAHFDAARSRLHSELAAVVAELEQLAKVRARLGLAPDTGVKGDAASHDDPATSPPAPTDHRDRRLR